MKSVLHDLMSYPKGLVTSGQVVFSLQSLYLLFVSMNPYLNRVDSTQPGSRVSWVRDLVAFLDYVLKQDTTSLSYQLMVQQAVGTYLVKYRNNLDLLLEWTSQEARSNFTVVQIQELKANVDAVRGTLDVLRAAIELGYGRDVVKLNTALGSDWTTKVSAVEVPAENTTYGCIKVTLVDGLLSLRIPNEVNLNRTFIGDVYYMSPSGMTKADSPVSWDAATTRFSEFLLHTQEFIDTVKNK